MADGTAMKLGGPDQIMLFFRDGYFYPIQGVAGRDLKQQAREHAELNPGTQRVEDINGNVLWSLQ